jgi:hypothetical protein
LRLSSVGKRIYACHNSEKKKNIKSGVESVTNFIKIKYASACPGKEKNIDSQPHFFHFLPELLKMTEIVIGNNNFIVKT